jgi:RHS repeat-associated protein
VVVTAVGVARSQGGGAAFYWIHTDHPGTPLAVTNTPATPGQATAVWRAVYTPFGEATVDEDPDGDLALVSLSLRFPGQLYDAETELHYNYFRDYDPRPGRYLQSDPVGLASGVNLYAYAFADPTQIADPAGLTPIYAPPAPRSREDRWGMAGKGRSGAVFERGAGVLTIYDKDGHLVAQASARSGSRGAQPINVWEWLVDRFIRVSDPTYRRGAFCDAFKNCWFLKLRDDLGRTGLGIHPDGNVPGTEGCIGLTAPDSSEVAEILGRLDRDAPVIVVP